MQVDHKDGHDCTGNELKHFQPVCRQYNCYKRQQCINCKDTGNRYDVAKILSGFPVSWYIGNSKHSGATDGTGCIGCYLYDPVAFRIAISANYNPKIESIPIIKI